MPQDSSPPDLSATPTQEDVRDLGFGSRIAQRSHLRLLNPDGTFNVTRRGLPFYRTLNPYHSLLTIPWTHFFGLVVLCYFAINLLFAAGYYLCGPAGIRGYTETGSAGRFLEAFFFSVQTLSTIGYGGLSPNSLAANLLVMVEALTALLFFAVTTGVIFARFSRPVARILFSRQTLIAPYHGQTALEMRIINAYRNQLIDVEATVIFSRLIERGGVLRRVFDELPLERPRVKFFPLQWTIVHPIDAQSPLAGMGQPELEAADAEFIVLLTAFDETFSQYVQARSSYKYFETVVGARFADMFIDDPNESRIGIDMRKLHEIEKVA